ncbi:MAG: hypothetical protein FWD57_08995 [Polyangiaceae bacterium]|nr:hypothetical protein [Polyangiaceae bacterium]
MANRHFFDPNARTKVRDAIVNIESQTSAEIVVAVRRQSGSYNHIDLAAGGIVAFITLLLLLFLPWEFQITWMPLETVAAFSVGFMLTFPYWAPKRWLTRNKTLKAATWKAACTTFHENKISRTSQRNGILVFVSMLERHVQIVTDIGIDTSTLGPTWQSTIDKMNNAVRSLNFDAFITSMEELGPILGESMPRAEDDINELPDEPVM